MNIFRTTALAIFAVFVITWSSCMIAEGFAIQNELHVLNTSMRIASTNALNTFQITQFSGFDDNVGVSYSMESDEYKANYREYLKEIEAQAKGQGLMTENGDITDILYFLNQEVDDFEDGNIDSVLSPFIFGWTYLDESKLEEEFEASLRKIIDYNYSPDSDTVDDVSLAFTGRDVLRIAGVDAEVSGPYLLNLSNSASQTDPEYLTYLKLFGTNRQDALSMIDNNGNPDMFNYVIAYDVKFSVDWEHHTITPLFSTLGKSIPSTLDMAKYVNEKGQIKLPMEGRTISRRYVITN